MVLEMVGVVLLAWILGGLAVIAIYNIAKSIISY